MDKLKILEKYGGKGRISLSTQLSQYTTLKLGGPAEYFYIAQTKSDIIQAVKGALEANIPYYVVGSGSNVLVSDKGVTGFVIRNESRSIKIVKRLGKLVNGTLKTERALVEVDSGVAMNQLVRFLCDEGLEGLERHLGLPGTVGGALYMNSKWTKPLVYVGDVLYQAEILTREGEAKTVNRDYFDFGYDQSILQKTHETVLSVTFKLNSQDKHILWERANASMEYRRTTQPMGVASAGCTFRNIPLSQALRLGTPENTTSAGYLVDQVGLKNFSVGKAKYSGTHANFILNLGGATASDVKNLVDEAKTRVKNRFNVEIEPEIILLGDFN